MLGQWNPLNKFYSMMEILDFLNRKIDLMDGGIVDSIGQRGKELNKELELVVSRMYAMKEVDYDKGKIDFLFNMTEKALEYDSYILAIIERLTALERIHNDSPNI
mmetsp:Transcript_14502/g.14113  ORF Transcript_14502/g.14113 Transcript_14502/m.14113 type:complete len:105 (+) Transcript_14502:234-548(+)